MIEYHEKILEAKDKEELEKILLLAMLDRDVTLDYYNDLISLAAEKKKLL